MPKSKLDVSPAVAIAPVMRRTRGDHRRRLPSPRAGMWRLYEQRSRSVRPTLTVGIIVDYPEARIRLESKLATLEYRGLPLRVPSSSES